MRLLLLLVILGLVTFAGKEYETAAGHYDLIEQDYQVIFRHLGAIKCPKN